MNEGRMGVPREGEMPEGEGGEIPEQVDLPEYPEDIGEREYVFQYTIFGSTSRNKRILVTTDIELTMEPRLVVEAPAEEGEEPEKLMGFPLKDGETKIKLSHKFRVTTGWSGWMLGSKKMTFNQMISEYDYKDLKVKATVK